jgi:lipoprotein-anchoring transpeptidase ErfK/SrfK
MGVPRSHGCIRMRNRDLLELFEQVDRGTLVHIVEY